MTTLMDSISEMVEMMFLQGEKLAEGLGFDEVGQAKADIINNYVTQVMTSMRSEKMERGKYWRSKHSWKKGDTATTEDDGKTDSPDKTDNKNKSDDKSDDGELIDFT